MKYVVVATWPFSEPCVVTAMDSLRLRHKHTAVNAVETAISEAEKDPSYGPYHVGCGGWQNEAGCLELDAAIMDGHKLDFGAVTALSGFKCPISVARRVMEVSRHSVLTGEGAKSFASSQGFQYTENMGTPWQQNLPTEVKGEPTSHDTLGLLALNMDTQELCAGVSTSGMSCKAPGRVGDSALPGCGLYADSQIAAACCTGDGDHILKHCPSFRVVQLIKQGVSPQSACDQTVREIMTRVQAHFELGIVAVDRQGNVGASNMGIHQYRDTVHNETFLGFPYVVYTDSMEKPRIITVPPMEKLDTVDYCK